MNIISLIVPLDRPLRLDHRSVLGGPQYILGIEPHQAGVMIRDKPHFVAHNCCLAEYSSISRSPPPGSGFRKFLNEFTQFDIPHLRVRTVVHKEIVMVSTEDQVVVIESWTTVYRI